MSVTGEVVIVMSKSNKMLATVVGGMVILCPLSGFAMLFLHDESPPEGKNEYMRILLPPAVHLFFFYGTAAGCIALAYRMKKRVSPGEYTLIILILALWTAIIVPGVKSDLRKRTFRRIPSRSQLLHCFDEFADGSVKETDWFCLSESDAVM